MKKRTVGIGLGIGTAAAGIGLALFSAWHGRRGEAQVPADGVFVDVDGARLHYVDQGTGPAIVLVHGLGGQLRNFTYALAEILARRHRVIAVDRPRSGYSTTPAGSEPGIVDQAAIVARFIAALGLDRPLLVGHSLGGAVALALAEDHPELVRGLALLAPLTQPQEDAAAALRLRMLRPRPTRALVARMIGIPLARLASRRPDGAVFAPEIRPDDFATRGGGVLALRPGNMAAIAFEASRLDEEMAAIAARYGEIDRPVAILFGRGDQVLDPQRNGVLTAAQIDGATIELIDGGHMIPVTQPDITAAFIERAAGPRPFPFSVGGGRA